MAPPSILWDARQHQLAAPPQLLLHHRQSVLAPLPLRVAVAVLQPLHLLPQAAVEAAVPPHLFQMEPEELEDQVGAAVKVVSLLRRLTTRPRCLVVQSPRVHLLLRLQPRRRPLCLTMPMDEMYKELQYWLLLE